MPLPLHALSHPKREVVQVSSSKKTIAGCFLLSICFGNRQVCKQCAGGQYLDMAAKQCKVCPAGFFCPVDTEDAFPLSLQGVLPSQRQVTGLTDFTCRKGFFKSSNSRYCCNLNTKPTSSSLCNECHPGFVYNPSKQQCVA